MKFYHRCILIAGAIVWFLLFWNISDHATFKSHSAILIKIVSVLGPVILIYYTFTAAAEDLKPTIYDYDESKFKDFDEGLMEEKKDDSP